MAAGYGGCPRMQGSKPRRHLGPAARRTGAPARCRWM